MPEVTRREWFIFASALAGRGVSAASDKSFRFGFSLYGMKTLSLAEALRICAEIGYDCVELALMPGYPSEPSRLSAEARRELRQSLEDRRLALAALMENLHEPAEGTQARTNENRLKAAAELAYDLSPKSPPVIETVIGGKPKDWEQNQDRIRDRMRIWARLGESLKTIIAIKPHVANALHTPEAALWLIQEVNSPWLKLVYDHSHFALQGLRLADTMSQLLPESVFIHIKDFQGSAQKFEFLLPGTGNTDYGHYARLLRERKYQGAVVVEVSAQIFNKPGYDAVKAAKLCYEKLKPAFS